MKSIGYDLTGGKTGTLSQLNNQLDRLLNCRFCLIKNRKDWKGQTKKTKDYINQISRIELWESGEGTESDSQVKAIISESYYNWVQETAYPVDRRTVEALRSSLLALDLYLFLCSRTFRINPKKYETYISWASLEKQLGTDYKETKQFSFRARKEIEKIKEWYPELNIRFERGCLVLVATSKPHIKSYPQK